MWMTMLAIRHKTHHPKFMVGLPCILVLQIICAAVACMHIPAFSTHGDVWIQTTLLDQMPATLRFFFSNT